MIDIAIIKSSAAPIMENDKDAPKKCDQKSNFCVQEERRENKVSSLESEEGHQLPAKLENPLARLTVKELLNEANFFCADNSLMDQVHNFRRGAILAGNPSNLDRVPDITNDERRWISHEEKNKWKQPMTMYYIAIISSMAAIVQGMDEAVVNGAQIFYYDRFGIPTDGTTKRALVQGLVNSAPYLCCTLSCWLTEPLNRRLGRRGVIFVCCLVTALASIWEAFTYSWQQLLAARLILGFGVGPISATAPIYTAECAPASIRGALVMQWQVWTAFGIALGDIVSVMFVDTPPDLAWRLMLGSTVVAPIVVCLMIYRAPESPRWYMSRGRIAEAYQAMCRLRFCNLQAARDVFYMAKLLAVEQQSVAKRSLFPDLWRVPRVRRAAQSSALVMFMQQFCGVNVIAYYSSQIFIEAGFGRKEALLTTMGTGLVNWVFAIPAMYTIDTFGRRNLLLITLPCMAACLLATGMAFCLAQDGEGDHRRVTAVATSIYLYMAFYSPGEGPVPFTYSAEAFPLYIRDLGMSFATVICWFFNFVLAVTFPLLLTAFKAQGAFSWYAAWCMAGAVLVYFFLPETKALTLEELDAVFSVPTSAHAAYQFRKLIFRVKKSIFRRRVEPFPSLHEKGTFLPSS